MDVTSLSQKSALKVLKSVWELLLGGFWGRWLQIWSQNLKIQNVELNMAVKYMIFLWNFNNFTRIRLGMVTRGFSEVADYECQNKKWRIQYGQYGTWIFDETLRLRSNSLGNGYPEVFEVADYESEVRISKFKMAVSIRQWSTLFFFENLTILLSFE